MQESQYTYRDKIKFACYNYALEQGWTEEEMTEVFIKAAEYVRAAEKTALLSGTDVRNGLGAAGLVGLGAFAAPSLMLGAGHLGYAGGQGVRRLSEGRIAKPEEVHLMDETAEYKGAIEEIRRRMILNRLRELQSQTPSNRRMF